MIAELTETNQIYHCNRALYQSIFRRLSIQLKFNQSQQNTHTHTHTHTLTHMHTHTKKSL